VFRSHCSLPRDCSSRGGLWCGALGREEDLYSPARDKGDLDGVSGLSCGIYVRNLEYAYFSP
jgi:hypothetical protein